MRFITFLASRLTKKEYKTSNSLSWSIDFKLVLHSDVNMSLITLNINKKFGEKYEKFFFCFEILANIKTVIFNIVCVIIPLTKYTKHRHTLNEWIYRVTHFKFATCFEKYASYDIFDKSCQMQGVAHYDSISFSIGGGAIGEMSLFLVFFF